MVRSCGQSDVIQHLVTTRLVALLISSVGVKVTSQDDKSSHAQLLKLKRFMNKRLVVAPACIANGSRNTKTVGTRAFFILYWLWASAQF